MLFKSANHTDSKPSKGKRWTISIIITLVLLIVIIVPLAVLLPQRNHNKPQQANIIVPLYIYPDPGAYDPLYTQIEQHPKTNFTLIINPDSGPGNDSFPDANFTSALTKFNTYPNVRSIGYVHVTYGTRNISAVVSEVNTYAGWGKNSSRIAIQGIFFDEAPGEWTSEVQKYMEDVDKSVKGAGGIGGERMIVHNPGTVPDARLLLNSTNVSVVFEGSYSYFQTQQSTLKTVKPSRSRLSYMVYGVAEKGDELKNFVKDISRGAEYVFVTDLTEDYYESFGGNWGGFVGSVPT